MKSNKFNILALSIFLTIFLSWCDWFLTYLWLTMCQYAPDSDHCYQWTAVQSWNPADCDKIKWTKFKNSWSNPPRDKCYMQIAINTWDYSSCKKIQWGLMSYTTTECIQETAKKNDDPSWCKKLSWSEFEACRSIVANPEKMKNKDSKIDELIEQLKNDKNNKTLKTELDKLKKDKQDMYEMMEYKDRVAYFSWKREEIMWEVEDPDVKSAIANEYKNFRTKSWEWNINKLLDWLQDIKERQELIKKLDEDANTLVDDIKWPIVDYANWEIEWIQGEVTEKLAEKWKEWIEKNWWDTMKWSLKKMEWAMEKYEKWSEQYEAMKSKYDKFKWAYDEAMEVYWKIDKVNKLLAEWKIDAKQANVLHWWVLLWKSLEYATWYIPVFWSTASKVTKATFETVMKVAEKRAARTNAINKCIDDPEHCDFDNVTAY